MARILACTRCHHVGPPRSETRGSFVVELFLWLCLLIPGLLYSLWRLSSRRSVCRFCGATELVPITSPLGRQIAASGQFPT